MSNEHIDFETAQRIAEKHETIKNHDVFFTTLENHYGYSALVFKNNRHIHYADLYQLHYEYTAKEHGLEYLHEYFVKILNERLFTDEELLGPITSYADYRNKIYYAINYVMLQYDTASMYFMSKEEAAEKQYNYVSHISMHYAKTPEPIEKQAAFYENLKNELKKNLEKTTFFKKAVKTELANHEAGYSCEYDDALRTLGLRFENLTETQQKIVLKELDAQIRRCE